MRMLLLAACVTAIAASATAAPGERESVATAQPSVVASQAPAPAPWSDAWLEARAQRYLDDRDARRSALEASLGNPENLYAKLRLASYALPDRGWDALPEWNPRVARLSDADVPRLRDGDALLPAHARVLWDGTTPTTHGDWIALGRRVFFGYPLRAEPAAAHALATGSAAELGLHRVAGEYPGLVAYRDPDGIDAVGITCALCHASGEGDTLVVGRARRDFDFGAMRLRWHAEADIPIDPRLVERMASWGPGRADITEDDDRDPVAIPDLWRMRSLRHFTQAATIVHRDTDGIASPLALAIRQETQYIHAGGERTRPPRVLTWALAMYLYSLEPPAVAMHDDAQVVARGRALFEARCTRCHGDDASHSGAPVTARRVGTDPSLADGHARGTGHYRPAPLVAVADAAPYLHDGSVPSLHDLFDPTRMRPDYRGGRAPGAVLGHGYGLDLTATDRAALVAWLRTL